VAACSPEPPPGARKLEVEAADFWAVAEEAEEEEEEAEV